MSSIYSENVSLGPFKPVNENMIREQSSVTLSNRKLEYLKDFTSHYCQKNQRSKRLARQYRPFYADQRAVSFFHLSLKELCFPLVFDKAKGCEIWDIDGNKYIDIAMDFGICLFGHKPAFLHKVLQYQLKKGWALSMRPEKSMKASKLLCELTCSERAVFSQSGTEAVMTAVRIARHVNKRKKIVMFTNSYHGHSDGLLAFNMKINGKNMARPVTAGTPPGMVEDVVVLDYAVPETLEAIQSQKAEIAAVLVEPMQSRGLKAEPRDFLHELRVLTEKNNIALIFDEMITGLRITPSGAQGEFGVKPDLSTYGKILGGGLSLGAIAGKAKYLDAIDGGLWDYEDKSYPKTERTFFAGTHCQNTLAMSAACEILTYLKKKGAKLQKSLNQTSDKMCKEINEFLLQETLPFKVYNFGSLFRFEYTERTNPIEQNLFLYHLRDNGVMVSEVGNNFLSTAHNSENLQMIIKAVKGSVFAMKSGGYFQ